MKKAGSGQIVFDLGKNLLNRPSLYKWSTMTSYKEAALSVMRACIYIFRNIYINVYVAIIMEIQKLNLEEQRVLHEKG